MKIVCCCITCVVGENPDQPLAEEERLIEDDKEPSDAYQPPGGVLSPEKCSPASSPGALGDASLKAAEILRKNKVSLGSKKLEKLESANRIVGVLKKYNLKSKHGLKTDEESQVQISLKISIKMMIRSDVVKIFAIEASNVLPMVKNKNPDVEDTEADELLLVQLRTKLLPSEVRGHSRKFEVYESTTGSMKFSNELLHSLTIAEYKNQQVRFRLYNIFKQKRDILLGEYILDLSSLNLTIESSTTNVILQLHDPNVTHVHPPEVCETQRLLSSSSGTGSSGQFSPSSTKAYRSTIRRGDVKTPSRKSLPFFSNGSEIDQKPGSPSHLHTVEENVQNSEPEKESGPDSPFQKLIKGITERNENVEQLQTRTEEMVEQAHSFGDVSTRLREKYEKKQSKKRLL